MSRRAVKADILKNLVRSDRALPEDIDVFPERVAMAGRP